jgi:hypothetical protein
MLDAAFVSLFHSLEQVSQLTSPLGRGFFLFLGSVLSSKEIFVA